MAQSPNVVLVATRVPKDVAEYLQQLAAREERSVSWVVGRVLKLFVEEEKEAKK